MGKISKRLAQKLIYVNKLRKIRQRRIRKMNIRPIFFNRGVQGDSILVKELRSDPQYHHHYFRMDKSSFDNILEKVKPLITGSRTHCRPISAIEKLAITLRFLASGNSQISLALSFRISPSSIGKIIRQVCSAIIKTMKNEFLPPPTEDIWIKNEEGFKTKWNHPNAIGAMDGKHIRIQAPKISGSTNFNYKGFYSIVLMAVVDPNYKFSVIDVGASGSQSDGGIFHRSMLGKKLENGTLNVPHPKLVGQDILPHVIVADDAFPLKSFLMKPFPGKFLTEERRIYNYRQSRARMTSENTFGIFSARWRIFHAAIIADIDLVKKIVETAVILHNFLINLNDFNTISPDICNNEEVVFGSWREEVPSNSNMSPFVTQGSNNFTTNAAAIREKFMKFFTSPEGSVSWQRSRI